MTIEIREVKNLRQLKTFVNFPLTLYKGNPYYVPPLFEDDLNTLRKDKNPAFDEARARYWLAYKDGVLAGRIAAMIVPSHQRKWGEKYMRFGWLDFIDDEEVLRALIGEVEAWAHAEGMEGVHGPLGFTDLDREGMLVEGFDEMTTLATIYNYPYYPQYLEKLGYVKDVDWLEHEFTMDDRFADKIGKAADLIAKKYNLHMFKGGKKELIPLVPQIFDVINEAYRNLYGTVPLSERQVETYKNTYFGFVITDFVPIVLDANEKVVAFGITFPSFSKALQRSQGKLFPFGFVHLLSAMYKNDTADLYLVGVRDEYLRTGVTAMIMNQIMWAFKKHGIKHIETNATLETNLNILSMWKYLPMRQHKRRRAYVKHFKQPVAE